MPNRLLILGGTAEAAELAEKACGRFGDALDVVTSLAGRVTPRRDLAGTTRVGGFGGAGGLTKFLADEEIDWVIDATHPFAADISAHALAACAEAGVARLVLIRPPWRPAASDQWHEVNDLKAAAERVPAIGRRAFLTVGANSLGPFAAVTGVWFLVRVMEEPTEPPPLGDHTLIAARPPFTLEDERRLLGEHRIDVLVSKQSGGMTESKLTAAREAGIPVVMVRRPPPPPGEIVETVDSALSWLEEKV